MENLLEESEIEEEGLEEVDDDVGEEQEHEIERVTPVAKVSLKKPFNIVTPKESEKSVFKEGAKEEKK